MRYTILFICLLFCGSCRKLLDPGDPIDGATSGTVYQSDVTAAAVLTGLFYNMSNEGAFMGGEGISYLCGLSADEFLLLQEDELALSMYKNQLTPGNIPVWALLYKYIYQANAAIEGLTAATRLTPAIRQQLTGEAKFIRAFCYFYLVNLFDEVPLVTGTDYKVNANMHRTPVVKVYELIIKDLEDAASLLRTDYLQADIVSVTADRVRPNKWAATALLARVQLYRNNWQAAITAASALIDNKAVYDMVPLSNVFLKDSKEAIWQLQPVNSTFTGDASLFIQQRPVLAAPVFLQTFEKDDLRKQNWLGKDADYPYKYKAADPDKPVTEYLMVLRLSEQYLIRAEARLHTADKTGALEDLMVVRRRAGLPAPKVNGTGQLDEVIQHERQVELFSEWGHRWLDLKRIHTVNTVMKAATATKGGDWKAYQQWFPIPRSELLLNPNLTQNEGYQE
ncbi:RagB/SusD family nutrient uptake outer membrane protein [Chitinophaga ginsengisoli]|uniref:SusD-like starch-binding protein associating with outer membrane n=1 Tax=Chitinophaga ginsengisoli TaxID=363837 RepID=A0A2P8GHZ9_9BACT|nr:RagB/SusD family nutrient uptake outer membrane protein [Chitinophaga ginsengisoli]PSL33567.1 SusD-like starch-binding protein associating with outer membrane [Chitinophaga ginsengisoli]